MARAKTQLTGFSRFLIFLLIATPVIFFGVTTYKGEDPMQTLRDLVSGKTTPTEQPAQPTSPANSPSTAEAPAAETAPMTEIEINGELAKLREENVFKDRRITDLYRENEELKAALKDKEAELQEAVEQLEKIRSAIGQ